MKTIYSIVAACLLTNSLLAQSNYVANTANGSSAAPYNTLVGVQAGANINSSGQSNVFTGYQAGYANTSGVNNVFVGLGTGYNNTTGIQNVAVGHQAGVGSGSFNNNNVSIGYQAGIGSGSVSDAVNIGYMAGHASTGISNVFVGSESGRINTTGGGNAFLGFWSGHSNTTGTGNSFVGFSAGGANTTGSQNTFVGNGAGAVGGTGNYNSFVGAGVGSNTTGSQNAFIGANSGESNTTGSNNVFSGYKSGYANTTGAGNTFLGYQADAGANNLTNATAIGNNAKVNLSNALVLGSGANVGIGTSAPTARLHLTTGNAGQSGLRLENLTSTTAASVGNQTKFLTVDASGNVILGSLSGSARAIADESLWQRSGSWLQSSGGASVVIGSSISQPPGGYKLYVEQGILTEKVKVAVKNTGEWSDYVFEPGYKLATLAEVEAHILQTGHLTGIPSAEQMVAHGNDLHQTDARLVAKVEELTLYSIQLEKRAQRAETQNQQQQGLLEQQQAQLTELKQLVRQLLDKK